METIQLNDQVTVSRVIQGFWRLHTWNMTSQELLDFMHQCVDLGVTTFDTAEIYGNYDAERLMGEALKLEPEFRKQIQIITKTGINKLHPDKPYRFKHYETGYDKIIRSCHESLEKLNTKVIDIYLIHREDPFFDHREAARAFDYLIKEGSILSYGVCNYDPIKFETFQRVTGESLVTKQIELNPLEFEHFDSGLLDLLQAYPVHPMFWSPLAGGSIFTSYEKGAVSLRIVLHKLSEKYSVPEDTLVYAWLLKHPVKGMVISGSQKIDRLKNAINGLDVNLELEDWYEIYLASGTQVLR
jgi:predicted oxidoreductase